MSTSKRLDFSSPSRVGGDVDDDSDDYCAPLTRRKSLRSSASKRAASDAVVEQEPKKKKKKLSSSSSVINRIWSEDDELAILKGLVEFRAKKGFEPSTDWDAFYDFIKGSIHVKVSKDQLLSKIRKLKKKFLSNMERIKEGENPLFDVSMMFWGNKQEEMLKEGEEENANAEFVVAKITENKTAGEESHDNGEAKTDADCKSLQELVDKITENRSFGKESHDNDEAGTSNANGNSLQELVVDRRTPNKTAGKESHDNEAGKSNANGNSLQELVVDRRTPNKTAGKESHDIEAGKSNANGNSLQVLVVDRRTTENTAAARRESDDDELCAVRDAFETMISQGLSDYQKKLQLEKLMNIDSENRKEVSNEWKALCDEERKLKIKKLRFSAKLLVEAAIDG